MKTHALLLLVLMTSLLSAQSFTEVMDTPLDGVIDGEVVFTDVDGDDDQDLIITGVNSSTAPLADLYLNDGAGNFSLVAGTPFDGIRAGSVAVADVNGDDAPDMLITGINNSFSRIAKLYTNDGSGNFSEYSDTSFTGVQDGTITFADVDGDDDQDVLITGRSSPSIPSTPISKLYLNDGAGNFAEDVSNSFSGVYYSSVAFADVDGDEDPDLLITGVDSFDASIAILYSNDGAGNFAEVAAPFDGVRYSAVAFADVNGDNTQDVFITGWRVSGRISKLYTNDGAGNFTEMVGTPFVQVSSGAIAFADVDNDDDNDVLVTGEPSTGRISNMYLNDGAGNFTLLEDAPFDSVLQSSVAFADVNGDNTQDVLITGVNLSNRRIAKLYTNTLISSTKNASRSLDFEFDIYPNPVFTSLVQVRYVSQLSSATEVQIYNFKGQRILEQVEISGIGASNFSIDVSQLQRGVYVLQLIDGNKTSSRTFIIH